MKRGAELGAEEKLPAALRHDLSHSSAHVPEVKQEQQCTAGDRITAGTGAGFRNQYVSRYLPRMMGA
jgi:hypothetical protein